MRLILILLAALALAPGTWIRSAIPPPDLDGPVILTPLASLPMTSGEITLVRGWRLASGNDNFGSYSALLAPDGQQLIAASDHGRIMRLAIDGDRPRVLNIGVLDGQTEQDKRLIDVESITSDPQTGRVWLGYEGANAIERRTAQLSTPKRVFPPQMRKWSANSGAEAMVRLADGRFIILAEGAMGWGKRMHDGLLFPSDPVVGAVAEEFRFNPPKGYRPVDMVQIPDGRVLILVRRVHWEIMPRFTAKLVVADPTRIHSNPGAAEAAWSGTVIAEFRPPVPSDNYEGLAVVPRADGLLDLWMVSDDNNASFQSTYLLQMRWNPGSGRVRSMPDKTQKARSQAARP